MRNIFPYAAKSKTAKVARQRGFTLIEFMLAMVVLAVGLAGIMPLLLGSMKLDRSSAGDSTALMVAEVVMEQISSQSASSSTAIQVSDCATPANTWTINVADAIVGAGNGGSYGGQGAQLTSAGNIDWSQAYASVPAGYAMQYVACSTTNHAPVTYEVRWDLIQTSSSHSTKMVVVSARPVARDSSGLGYLVPVNLRTIIGM